MFSLSALALFTGLLQTAHFHDLFDRLDQNRDGQIVFEEIDVENRVIYQRLLTKADANKDSQISKDEFLMTLSDSAQEVRQYAALPQMSHAAPSPQARFAFTSLRVVFTGMLASLVSLAAFWAALAGWRGAARVAIMLSVAAASTAFYLNSLEFDIQRSLLYVASPLVPVFLFFIGIRIFSNGGNQSQFAERQTAKFWLKFWTIAAVAVATVFLCVRASEEHVRVLLSYDEYFKRDIGIAINAIVLFLCMMMFARTSIRVITGIVTSAIVATALAYSLFDPWTWVAWIHLFDLLIAQVFFILAFHAAAQWLKRDGREESSLVEPAQLATS